MRSIFSYSLVSIVVFIVSLAFMNNMYADQSTPEMGLRKYLPEKGMEEWIRKDSPQEYEGEDLFLYINGGAEIYNEYGFEQVIAQDYENEKGNSISLEIFEMSSSESAYGIYTFKTSPRGEGLSLGNQGRLEDYYLNFWKANFLVTLTGLDEDKATVRGLKIIARAVDAKLEAKGKEPSLVSVLPKEDLVASSIKYFKGNLGIYNIYPFFTKDVFEIKEGVKGDYEGGYSLFFIVYNDELEAKKRYEKAKRSFQESTRYRNHKALDEHTFQAQDSDGKFIFVSTFEGYLLIEIGTAKRPQSRIKNQK